MSHWIITIVICTIFVIWIVAETLHGFRMARAMDETDALIAEYEARQTH